ncbi:MAG: Gx transporter family protein [Dethiobacteria bacterium]
MKRAKTYHTVSLAVLLTFALVIHSVEASIPLPMPVPGVKLGLANIITLVVLLLFGFKSALLISVLRTVLGSFFVGNFFSFGFMLSFTAAVISTTVMILVLPLFYRGFFSLISISILGAVTHNIVQLTVASVLVQNLMLLRGYLPLSLFMAIPTGFFTGLAAHFIVRAMSKVMKF